MAPGLVIRAPAKLNLSLAVLARRPDGFHEIESLMVPVTLHDTLRVRRRDDGAITLAVRYAGRLASADGRGLARDVPVDDSNLVVRAARALRDRAGMAAGLDIELVKEIPSGAGLAVIACPATGLSTAAVYAACTPDATRRGDAERLAAALAAGDLPAAMPLMHNALETPARRLCGDVDRLLTALARAGAVAPRLTGSGSACFAVCRTAAEARGIAARLAAERSAGRAAWPGVFAVRLALPGAAACRDALPAEDWSLESRAVVG